MGAVIQCNEMDTATMSARQVARALGTSTPRVLRAFADAGVAPPAGRRARLTAEQVRELRARLGETLVDGLSRTEALVAAALARAPLGLASQRALAQRAGVSPTAAGSAIRSLHEKRVLPGRRAHRARVIRADYASPEWRRVAADLARVSPPRRARARHRSPRVPARLDYLFWNTADSQKDTLQAGGYIARRLLAAEDPEGLAWGAEHLRAVDWRHAAATRGIAPAARALARNLADSS
jgi:hypothetical protein